MRDRSTPAPPLRRLLAIVLALAALALASPARAHPIAYSKVEVTLRGRDVALVLGLDFLAVAELFDRDARVKIEKGDVEARRAWFEGYFAPRIAVTADGAPCAAPTPLARFFYDPATDKVVAATKYECPSEPSDLAIRSTLTIDMPTPHELVGDVRRGRASARVYWNQTSPEVHVAIASLVAPPPPSGEAGSARARSWAGQHDRLRQYDDLANEMLGGAAPEPPIAPSASASPAPAAPPASRGSTFAHYVAMGARHIFTGYDHVLFVVTLVLTALTWRSLAILVTSFTVAHSLTLAAATLGLVTVSPRLVEPLIAASVLYVAVAAVVRPDAPARVAATFGFGLLHGLGFSSVLRSVGLVGGELAGALAGFNVGVELGQLAIVIPVFAAARALRARPEAFARVRRVVCLLVAALAVVWIVQRVREALESSPPVDAPRFFVSKYS